MPPLTPGEVGAIAESPIAALILAAGASTRMGTPKQLLQFRGQTFIRRTVQTAAAAGLGPIVVVVGAHADRVTEEIRHLNVKVLHNQEWEKGMGSSIRCGMQVIPSETSAVVILLCDQPLLTDQHLRSLVQNYRSNGAPIVASEYNGTVGVPALFSRSCFNRLARIPNNKGGKSLIEELGTTVRCVPFPEGALDVDKPSDYDALPRVSTLGLAIGQ